MQEIACSDKNQNQIVIRSEQKRRLLENAEDVIELIENGKSYRFIAEKYGVRLENVFWFVNDSEHCTRAKKAQLISSYEYLEQAEQAIEAIQADDTPATVRRQVEKMNIALFKAKTKNRKELDLNYREEKQENNQQILVIPSSEALQLIKVNKDNKINE